FSADTAEESFAELRYESSVRDDAFDWYNGKEGETHQQVDSGHNQHTQSEGQGKGTARIPYLAGNLAGIPPSAKAEEGTDGCASNGSKDGFGSAAAQCQGHQVCRGCVAGDPRPSDPSHTTPRSAAMVTPMTSPWLQV